MVFEKLVAHLLEKYLSEYIENVDPKKFKIGVWSGMHTFISYRTILLYKIFLGDVVLENLYLKPNALVHYFCLCKNVITHIRIHFRLNLIFQLL